MSDYRVILESGWVVRDVETLDDAIGIGVYCPEEERLGVYSNPS